MRCSRLISVLLVALSAHALAFAQAPPEPGKAPLDPVERLRARRLARPPARSNTCATCHASLPDAKLRAPAEQLAKSVHSDARIGCTGCHQGDAADPTVRAHAVPGFQPRPTGDAAITICGGCHSDARFIRQQNPRLQVDQATLYDLSLHAKLAHSGDALAPSCADCHGSHGVARVSAPTAPVNRRNVDRLCADCHADAELMRPYAIPTDQHAKWQRGPHAASFAAGGDGPTCTGCHGPHAGAAAAGSTSHVCGSCHEQQLSFIRQSPHGKPFEQLGLSECTPCHDKHEAKAGGWLAGSGADSACNRCHARDEKVKRRAEAIAVILREARAKADGARRTLQEARRGGLQISGAQAALDELHTEELKLRSRVHTFDTAQMGEVARAMSDAASRTEALADRARDERRIQRRGYYLALGLSVALFLLLTLKLRQLERRRRRSAA
jgi:predicted CXXCH cytochrome family protein